MDVSPSPPTARLLRDDALMRLQRRIGLAPSHGLGVARRAILLAAIAWAPIAVWAWVTGRAVDAGGESLLDHYQVNVRLLLAVPLMIVAEGIALRIALRLAPHCADVGLYHGDPSALRQVGDGLMRLRDRVHPWVVAAGAGLGALAGRLYEWAPEAGHSALGWAGPDGAAGFGPAWYLWVGRPIFTACVAAWLWRAVLLGIALHRLSHTGFSPVATHPDRVGGFGFLQRVTAPFGLVAFALTSVVGAAWAHEIVVHGADVTTYAVPMALTIAIPTLLFLAPMLVLVGPMGRVRDEALLRYGALVARHGDALGRRWIGGERIDDPILEAPEIGAAADAATLYESVVRMRPVPLGAASVLSVAVPAALPMVAVLATQIPLATMARAIAGALL
jgi:hypothetical protein